MVTRALDHRVAHRGNMGSEVIGRPSVRVACQNIPRRRLQDNHPPKTARMATQHTRIVIYSKPMISITLTFSSSSQVVMIPSSIDDHVELTYYGCGYCGTPILRERIIRESPRLFCNASHRSSNHYYTKGLQHDTG